MNAKNSYEYTKEAMRSAKRQSKKVVVDQDRELARCAAGDKRFQSEKDTNKWIKDNLGQTQQLLLGERMDALYRTLVD